MRLPLRTLAMGHSLWPICRRCTLGPLSFKADVHQGRCTTVSLSLKADVHQCRCPTWGICTIGPLSCGRCTTGRCPKSAVVSYPLMIQILKSSQGIFINLCIHVLLIFIKSIDLLSPSWNLRLIHG